MKRSVFTIVCLLATWAAWGQSEKDSAAVEVSGKVYLGVSTRLNTDEDLMELTYSTNDPRLGTNSGNRYTSEVDDASQYLLISYGADLDIDLHPDHTLSLSLEGANSSEHAMGSRTESVMDKSGQTLSKVRTVYNHPDERVNELAVGLDYTYRLRRPGSALTMGYRYEWENEGAGVEQERISATGWDLFSTNVLEQKINYHTHHAHIDYNLPVAKGHLLDFGLAYNRRELTVKTEQDRDSARFLEADYRHLMQYGGAHACYKLRLGPVEAMARLEYRATRMQNRWLHDVLPTATVRYHMDSIHSLSAFYTIMLIRPNVHHLDTTRISDAFTTRYGNDNIVGVHVHNVALAYRMHTAKVDGLAEVRYLTANDGFNAIWMERDNRRIYTWGNEGVRHAVGLTLTADSHLGPTTDLLASANVMWDKRIAEAINLSNANWGVRANVRLAQVLYRVEACKVNLVLRGDYSFHNTLDVYSYAGHGGTVAGDLEMTVRRALKLGVGYHCLFKPDVHITQGAYCGTLHYTPGATHMININLSYHF